MKRLLAILSILLICGCTDAGIRNITTLGKSGTIKLYSGGNLVEQWESTGKICTLSKSDGWQFVDKKKQIN